MSTRHDDDKSHPPTTPTESQPDDTWDMIKHGHNPNLPPNHPVNALSPWRKTAILWSVAYAAMLANFSVAITQVAFPLVGKSFGVTPGDIANALGYNLLGLALGPFLWNPLSRSLGRRPVYLIGSFIFLPIIVWESQAKSYASYCVSRTFAGLVSAWSQTVPPATIADIFVVQVRGRKMSTFGIPVVIGPVIAPIFCAAIVDKHGWRNVFYLNLGLAFLQLVLMWFFVPETMWNEQPTSTHVDDKGQHVDDKGRPVIHIETAAAPTGMTPGRVGVAFYPWREPARFAALLLGPFKMLRYAPITLTSFYYGICFGFLSVGITVVMPQVFEKPPYSFATVPLGCAFLAFGIGGVLGKWSGGLVGDLTVTHFEKRNGQRQPEDRLWAAYPILPLLFIGCLLVGLQLQLELHWMVLLVGGAIAFFGLSACTGLFQTYVLETYLAYSMDTMAVFNFWKCLWGFATPFFCVEWGGKDGWIAAYCIQGAILVVAGAGLVTLWIWKGYQIRRWQGMPIMEKIG